MKAKRLKRKLSLKSTRSDLPLASRRAMGASGPSLPIHLGGAFGGGAAGAASSSLRALSRTHSVWVDSLGKTSSAFNHWARAWIRSPCSSSIFAAAARRCNSWACTSAWHCGHTKAHRRFLWRRRSLRGHFGGGGVSRFGRLRLCRSRWLGKRVLHLALFFGFFVF